MAWLYLIVAGLMEVGWPVGLKMAQQPENHILGIVIAVAFMAASGWFFYGWHNAPFRSVRLMRFGQASGRLVRF